MYQHVYNKNGKVNFLYKIISTTDNISCIAIVLNFTDAWVKSIPECFWPSTRISQKLNMFLELKWHFWSSSFLTDRKHNIKTRLHFQNTMRPPASVNYCLPNNAEMSFKF